MKNFIYATCLLSTVCDVYAVSTLKIGNTTYDLYTLSGNVTTSTSITQRGNNVPSDYTKYNTGFKQGSTAGYTDLFLIDKDTGDSTEPVLKHFYRPSNKSYLIQDTDFLSTTSTTSLATLLDNDNIKWIDSFKLNSLVFNSISSVTIDVTDNKAGGTGPLVSSSFTFTMGSYGDQAADTVIPTGFLNPKIECNIAQSYIDASISLDSTTVQKGVNNFIVKNGLANLDPQSYIIFGNNGLGYSSKSSNKNGTQNVPTFCPTLNDFSVITTDCIEELAHNCMPVILTSNGQGATFPGAKEDTSSPSYINTYGNTTDFNIGNDTVQTNISSSQTFLTQTYATFPFPAGWNGLNYDGYNVPLPGFSPVTVPNTASNLLSGYQGSTLPIQVSALNKYYIYTLAGGTNYKAENKISFDFCLASDALMTKVTKWGRLDVTLKSTLP